MESSEGPQAEIRHTVRKYLEDFELHLTGELTEKLTERDKIYSAEVSHYLQEIDALRLKAAKTEELEAENSRLNVELEEVRQRHQEPPKSHGYGDNSEAHRMSATLEAQTKTESQTVNMEEYNRVKEDLVKLEGDYGKLVWARDHLETKVREQKDSLRQWKEYRKNWILKHPNKRLSHLQPNSARASPLKTMEDRRSTSAPAPPAIPEGLTPFRSGISRSTSPHCNAPAYPKDKDHRHDQALEHNSKDPLLPPDDISISQAGHSIVNASDSGDVTEATPESEGQAESVKVEPATGDSSPIIVFERSLKRRHSVRGNGQNINEHEDDQRHLGAAPVTLPPKAEHISSPISAPTVFHSGGPHDSLDLDEVGGHLDTPRKRQRMAQERLRSTMVRPSTTVQDEEDMLDAMTVAEYPQRVNSERLEIESERDKQASLSPENDSTLPEKRTEEEKKAHRAERIARQHAHNDRVHRRLEAAERRDPIFDPPRSASPITNEPTHRPHTPKDPRDVWRQKPSLDSPVILQPRNVNVSVLPRTGDPSANRKRPFPPSRRDRRAAYVPALAEDGEGPPSNCNPFKAGKKFKDDQTNLRGPADKEPKAPPTHHRLGALLTKPSPEKSLLTSEEPVAGVSPDQAWSKTPVHQSVFQTRSKGPATPRSLPAKRSELNHGPGNQSGLARFESVDATMDRYSKSAQAVTKRTKMVPAFSKPPLAGYPETRPEHEPLRARPVHRLGLQDFKLNPAHSEYAYHESVRRHDEKNSLSGCTDRHCQRCKGLREHVTSSGYKTAQKPGESEDEADWRLMQDFLGDNHRQLRTMTTKERSDLLIEAKVREFANRFGSHRQAFPRPREAPGMWDVDFPTTQKDAEDRAAADLIEREKVQERYWEATRPKGKWIFADE